MLEEKWSLLNKEFQALSKKEESYLKSKRWFKPFLWIAGAALIVTCIIPFILPITTPILIGGLILLLGRGAIYKWAYGDPRGTLKKLHERELLPLVLRQFGKDLSLEKTGFYRKEDLNSLRLFYRRLDSKAERGAYSNEAFRVSHLTGFHERVTVGTVLHDFGEDVLMSLMGTEDAVMEDSRSKFERIFHGFFFEIPNVTSTSNWMVVPSEMLPLYRKKSHYPQNLFISTAETGNSAFLVEKGSPLPDGTIMETIKSAHPIYLLAQKGKVYFGMPIKGNPFKANFDHKTAYSQEQLERFQSAVASFHKIKELFPPAE